MIHNSVVTNLQSDISGLSWIDNVYPLAGVAVKNVNGSEALVPCIYGQQQQGEHNYIEPFANSTERAGCFFELPQGDYDFNFVDDEMQYEINVIFWANLNRIADRTYDFTDELLASALNAFSTGYYKNDITAIKATIDRDKVFNKYGYSFKDQYSFLYPKTCFKITLTMNMNNNLSCFNDGTFDASFSPVC
jgi:hypothetical protein